jgi:sirohydrochlorin cobaltochelatase
MSVDGIVLVGHGGVPSDCPRELVTQLKALEGRRRASGAPASVEEQVLDQRIRSWPRTPATDPYRAGLERVAERMRARLGSVRLVLAYNEFCAPTVADAVAELASAGRRHIVVLPSMLTPGGVHSEREIPETIDALRASYPGLTLEYAWPFDLDAVAALLAGQALGAPTP